MEERKTAKMRWKHISYCNIYEMALRINSQYFRIRINTVCESFFVLGLGYRR